MNTQTKCITNALTVLAHNNGFTLWHYKALNHRLSEIIARGYFEPVGLILRPDDQIHVTAQDGAMLAVIDCSGQARSMAAALPAVGRAA